ncbi:hypothetical protein PC110_g5413 [Phytophthora cactorum]|nr:hypothetical protein PC119_g12693 [Phytophthora cactorum]RAW38308.1 hypothetical protein PC110_g5413 [Phytophthora cactorum]
MRGTTELSGRRRHDQQRLLVELELDDSLYQGAIRAGTELNAEYPNGRRSSSAGDTRHSRQVHSSYGHHFIAETKPRLQSRPTATKPLTERQMQQAHAKRLSSPYKLKKQVLGSRNDRYQHHSASSGSAQMRLSSLEHSPAQLVIESVQQNIHLRDQVMAHLQQELMGVLPLHRASHVEKNMPQRVVKLLNRMRSLSLAVVEAVVYLSSELGASSVLTKSFEHEVLEQDFYGYLLQMASSDTDFLACSPQLQRFFEDFDVNLARNPFVDGLSLDSSEVLLCACHQSASSGGLFCSASSSSSSLLRLLTQKLETFALQTQRYLPGWQMLPAERVAAALLHLMDLETRSKAVQMLPRYLQSHSYRSHSIQQHGPSEASHGYGTFGNGRIQRLDRQDSWTELSVMEAWTGSPTAKASDQRVSNKTRTSSLTDQSLPIKDKNTSRKAFAGADSAGVADGINVELTRLVLPLDTAAIAKSSSRNSSSEQNVPQKKSRTAKATFTDAEIQMSRPSTPTAAATQTTCRSARNTSEWSVHDEEGDQSERKPSAPVIGNTGPRRDTSDVDIVQASNCEFLNHAEIESLPVVEPLVLPRDTVEGRLNRLVNAMETSATEPQVEYEAEGTCEAGTGNDNGYECDFEYSSNSALSSIAMALQMLPDFSESTRTGEVFAPEEAIPLIEPESVHVQSSKPELGADVIDSAVVLIASATPSNDTVTSSLFELGISLENNRSELESVDQRVEMPPPEDDEYAYSSTTAISNIAMALSLLPGVSRGDIFSTPEVEADTNSPRTYRSIVSRLEEPSVEVYEGSMEDIPDQYSSSSARSNISVETNDQPIHLLPFSSHRYGLTSERTASSSPVSSRSSSSLSTRDQAMNLLPFNISAATNYQGDGESDASEFNRIFALCRDIQVAAFDMSHWVSQREVEDHIQSVAQPFSSFVGYSSPTTSFKTENVPKYLERELKMLRRNFASWKCWVIDHKRAKLVVRRLVARRKVRQFVLHHYRRCMQARIDQENRRRGFAASRIQRNWRIYCHNLTVARRKATFRALHMAFYRSLFFVGISRRRSRREDAKEKIVRWWRHHRFRIKKKRQRREKLFRERERRVRALRDIQKFLKEILLRRKLKATQEMAKKILFKEQLKWTKAKREMERSMRLDSKHRIELITDMNARFADLDRKWKASEYERLMLLSHHERVVQQQQQAVEVRKRRLAALKIQMFYRVCLLHEKLQRVEMEKKNYELKFQEEVLTKEKLDVESQQRIGKIRTQVRVLERKINRMSREATQTDAQHRVVVQAHQEREKVSQEVAARQKIKAFIDARVLCRRAERERRRLLLDQARLLAEKTESELMSSEDQLEQRRTAVSIALDLTQRLSEMETRSETLLTAKKQLAVQKEQEARQAAEALERSRVQASMNLIASWASGRMQLSKVQKEKTAISASAARTLELEKQKQRHAIEAKNCEISSIRASNFMHQRISQQRNHKTVERIHLQHRQKTALDKSIAERTRAQLVQIILDVKLLTERESSRGIDQGLASVAQFYKTQLHKFARLKHLRNVNCARKIQRNWRRWMRSKRAQELAMAQLEEAKRRRGLARRIQIWWRKWAQRRREQQRIFNAHLEAIRVRANVRKIQGVWRRWIQCERERRHQEQVAFEAHLVMIRTRAYVRKIQGVWRRWVERRLAFSKHVETMRQTASVRKIQAAWRRWVQDRRARRHVQQLAFEAQLKLTRIRANTRKIQRVWRRWVKSEDERRQQQQIVFNEHLESIRVRANARKIQRVWRRWVEDNKKLRERRRAHRTVFSSVLRIQRWWRKWRKKQRVKATRARIMQHACAQVIQKKWRRWHRWRIAKRERQRLRVQREFCAKKLQKLWRNWREWKRRREESAKRIQKQWDKWQKEKLEAERVRNAQMMAATLMQRSCRQWLCRRQYEKEKTRKQKEKHETRAAKRIQKVWRRWHQRSLEKAERQRQEEEERAVAVRIQQNWTGKLFRRNKQEAERKRHLGAQRIQGNYRRWRRQQEAKRARKRAVEHQRVNAIFLQRTWKKWHVTRQENERRAREQELQITAALVIQNQWRTHHATVRKPEEEETSQQEDERLQREYVANALKIQTFWRKKHKQQEEQRESERVEQTQNASSLKIQRNWGIRQHRRKMERQRIEHEQHMAALKIQTLWLKWHHEEQEELERERIRQEQDESSLKIQRNWGISHQRRKVVEERLRHKQNINALKIQKHWRRWRHLRLEQRTNRKDVEPQKPRKSLTMASNSDPNRTENELERQQNLEIITQRSYGRCIVRAVKRHHQSRREASAATKIEAIWKGWLYRTQYLQAVEAKHAEEVHQYRLMMSVLATKVQVCWRQWHVGVRQAKRAAVKSGELCLIEEAKALERKLIAAKRTLAAKRIQRALVSRRRLIATTGVSHREVVKEIVVEPENPMDKVDEQEPVAQPHIEEPTEGPTDQSQSEETPEEAMIRTTVELTVEDWSHRQLPHILSRSVNQILFCHEAATVLQKCVRGYRRRQQMHFSFQQSFVTSYERGNSDKKTNSEHFHFYFKRARAWLDWDVAKPTDSASLAESNQNVSTLRLRFDLQMTRKLLQLFEPSDDYLTSEIQQVLREITLDALPIFQSPVCSEDNDNPRSELRYHDVEEMELPLSVKLLRQMGRQHAQMRRQQLLEIDTSLEKLAASPPSPVAKSVPASPIGKSAASSPSRAKKEVTIHTAVENASVEDVTFLQQRGADLGALEPKTQRNALHLISFSKENHRSRAEVLEFLLTCGANLNVNAVDCIGDTPLMLYASLGHLEFMQKLLQHGADIRMTNNRGQNVLHRACEEDQVEICGFLQQLMLKDSIAEDIIPVEMISSLVPAALTLHIPDKSGRYPLHYLAEKGFVECAKQLIVPTEANFEWNRLLQAQGDSEGRTALHLAVLSHDVAMTAFLLTPGGVANVNSFDDLHRSPVHYAMESPAALTIISRLVQHGANVNVADERGDTPLHWAAFSGRAAVIQNLLTLGADPTLSNSDWETPAQIAAAYGQLDCMRLLLQAQRRFGPASTREPREQQQILHRPASEKTALERLEEAVNHLHQRQASMHSQHDDQVGGELEAPLAEQSQGGYWEELHRDVQLVEESGQFSSEDEENFLFGHDN